MNDPQDPSVDLPLEQAKKRCKGMVIAMDEPFQQVTRHPHLASLPTMSYRPMRKKVP
jgi:hypothetical protein